MAKPGSQDARALAGGVPLGKDVGDAREKAEGQAGLRCGGCGKRITYGFEFMRIEVTVDPRTGRSVGVPLRASACAGPDACGHAVKLAQVCDVMRPVKWRWLDEEGIRAQLGELVQQAKEGEEGDGGQRDPAA